MYPFHSIERPLLMTDIKRSSHVAVSPSARLTVPLIPRQMPLLVAETLVSRPHISADPARCCGEQPLPIGVFAPALPTWATADWTPREARQVLPPDILAARRCHALIC